MSFYQITQLEQLTGIKAHTIRIWEKRYKLLTPLRTETNIRYYNDNQLRKLLIVSTLLSMGYKISQIAALDENELAQLLKEVDEKENNLGKLINSYTHRLISSMISYDELEFEKNLNSIIKRWGVYEGFINVVYPFLQKTGILWNTVDVFPAQEHFASNLIRKRLVYSLSTIDVSIGKSKKFLSFLPPGEWHEIGLLLSDFIIRSRGSQSVYLGQNVPLDNLEDVIKSTRPTHLFTHIVTRKTSKEVNEMLSYLLGIDKNIFIMIAGQEQLLKDIKNYKRVIKLNTPQELLAHL